MGPTVKDEPVVRDRNWITSRKPEDLKQFPEAFIELLESDRESDSAPSSRRSQPTAHAWLEGLRPIGPGYLPSNREQAAVRPEWLSRRPLRKSFLLPKAL